MDSPPGPSQQPVVLHYAAHRRRDTPLRNIVSTTLLFALIALLLDALLTYQVMVGSRALSLDPGEAAAQRELRMEKFLFATLFEAIVLALASTLFLAMQWIYWGIKPVDRPPDMRRYAIVVAPLYCGSLWLAWLIPGAIPLLGTTLIQVVLALILAALAGIFLGWARSRGA